MSKQKKQKTSFAKVR